MERLWAPWRMAYIKGEKPDGCVFCTAVGSDDWAEHFVLFGDETAFVMLNRYPYTNAHLLVLPVRHAPSLLELAPDEAVRLNALLTASTAILKEELGPDGFNIGMNIGHAAGAGIGAHAHWHIVPRWNGDNSYIPVLAEVRLINEHLFETYSSLIGRFEGLSWNGERYE